MEGAGLQSCPKPLPSITCWGLHPCALAASPPDPPHPVSLPFITEVLPPPLEHRVPRGAQEAGQSLGRQPVPRQCVDGAGEPAPAMLQAVRVGRVLHLHAYGGGGKGGMGGSRALHLYGT